MERDDGTNVSYRDYVTECRALAEQATELVADWESGIDDIGDAVTELVDHHQWSIYYYGHAIIMEHTENPNEAVYAGVHADSCLIDYGWLTVRSHFAVPAFGADVERFLS